MSVVSYGAALSRRMVVELEKARLALERSLATIPESAVFTREFQQQIQQQVLGTLRGLRDPWMGGIDDARAALIRREYDTVSEALLASSGKNITVPPLLPVSRVAAILDGPVGGRPMGEWVERHLSGTAEGIRSSLAQAVIKGESAADARRALQKEFGLSRNGADVIARTGLLQAASDAREAVYSDNAGLISSWTYLATLDARTCLTCSPDDGRTAKAREELPNVPRHPRCRCIIRPNTQFTEPLERPAVGRTERIERESKTGGSYTEFKQRDVTRVPDSTTYEDFFRSQPKEWQQEVLGEPRHALWSDGKVSLEEMRGVNDRQLSLEELKANYGDRKSGPIRENKDRSTADPYGSLSADADRLASVNRTVDAAEPDPELRPFEKALYAQDTVVDAEVALDRLDALPTTGQFRPGEMAFADAVKNPVLKAAEVSALDFAAKVVEPFGASFAERGVERMLATRALRTVAPAVRKSQVAKYAKLPEEAFTEETFTRGGKKLPSGIVEVYEINGEWVVGDGNHRVTAALLRGFGEVRVRVLRLMVGADGSLTLLDEG